MKKLIIETTKKREVINITKKVQENLSASEKGLCSLFIRHTTAAITTADLDPGTDKDMLEAIEEMTPDIDYRHPHNPSHVPDHIWSSIIGSSLLIPYEDSKLKLGTWQEIVIIEFNGPRKRTLIVNEIK